MKKIKSVLVINEKSVAKKFLKQSQSFWNTFSFLLLLQKKNILIESDTAVLLEHDTEAISLSWKSVECVETSLNLCSEKRRQVDTLTVHQLLWKLNSSTFKIYACTSPINRAGFLYFADHLKTKDEQQPLCGGAHFQEYIWWTLIKV